MEQVSEYKKNIAKTALAVGMTAALSGSTALLYDKVSHPKLSKQTIELLNSKIDDAFISSGLANKGVALNRVPKNYKYVLPKKIKFPLSESLLKKYMGKPEFFRMSDNGVFFLENSPLAAFHEMGHALDYNFGRFGKKLIPISSFIKRFAPVGLIAGAFILGIMSHFNNKNKKENTESVPLEKIKGNYGKFAALVCTIPAIPEITASNNAAKLARKVLPKNLFKTMKAGNVIAVSTYVAFAASTGTLVWGILKLFNNYSSFKKNLLKNKQDKLFLASNVPNLTQFAKSPVETAASFNRSCASYKSKK